MINKDRIDILRSCGKYDGISYVSHMYDHFYKLKYGVFRMPLKTGKGIQLRVGIKVSFEI